MGCKKPVENPELQDPIYMDFLGRADAIEKDIESKEKELESARIVIESPAAIIGEKKMAKETIFVVKNQIFILKQKLQFNKYSAESRKIYIRKQSLEAFKNDQDWVPKDVREAYFARKKLAEAPKTWARGVASKIPVKKEKKSAEGGEHH